MRITWLAISLAVYGHAQAANNDTYFWGPYRPNLYFGLRPRAPQSLMTGLLWFGTHNYQSISRMKSSLHVSISLALTLRARSTSCM